CGHSASRACGPPMPADRSGYDFPARRALTRARSATKKKRAGRSEKSAPNRTRCVLEMGRAPRERARALPIVRIRRGTMIKLRNATTGLMSVALLATACNEPDVSTESTQGPLVGGIGTTVRPEVGWLSNGCTATLIDPGFIITAAHCFPNFTNGYQNSGFTMKPAN